MIQSENIKVLNLTIWKCTVSLGTNIEYSSFNKDVKVVNITSSNPAEGKSSVTSKILQWFRLPNIQKFY